MASPFSPPNVLAACNGKLRTMCPSGLSAKPAQLPDPSLPVQVAGTLKPLWAVLCARAGANRHQHQSQHTSVKPLSIRRQLQQTKKESTCVLHLGRAAVLQATPDCTAQALQAYHM